MRNITKEVLNELSERLEINRVHSVIDFYPYDILFEAEVKYLDNIYYFNFEVSEGEPIDYIEEYWYYDVPLEEASSDLDKHMVKLPDEIVTRVLKEMKMIWSSNPEANENWREV